MTAVSLRRPWARLPLAGRRPSRAFLRWAAGAVVLLLAVGLTALAAFPTGAPTAARVVPDGARLAADDAAAGARVLLTVEGGSLVAVVAYEDGKGWLGVDLEPVPGGTAAAWAATPGEGPVPALSTVYGRAPGDAVRIHWADGQVTRRATARDGAYVAARPGQVGVERVEILEAGTVVLEVTEL